MTEKKSKKLYWSLKIASVLISCALPIWAICERFPIWTEAHGSSHSIGVGSILIAIVVLIIFRKSVFDFIKERIDIKHAPPVVVWLVMLVVSYVFIYLGDVMQDMTSVLWMGFIGCVIGTFLTYLSNKFKGGENE